MSGTRNLTGICQDIHRNRANVDTPPSGPSTSSRSGRYYRRLSQVRRAEADGADYLGSGAVFGSTTKLNAKPMTKELLREITAAVDIPVVAIGGINADNAVTLKGTGIAGIAVVGAIFASADIKAAAKELAEICDKIL